GQEPGQHEVGREREDLAQAVADPRECGPPHHPARKTLDGYGLALAEVTSPVHAFVSALGSGPRLAHHATPVRRITTGTVRTRIPSSRQSDGLRKKLISSRQRSVKSIVSLPMTCHGPVTPGAKSRRSVSQSA